MQYPSGRCRMRYGSSGSHSVQVLARQGHPEPTAGGAAETDTRLAIDRRVRRSEVVLVGAFGEVDRAGAPGAGEPDDS